MIHIFTLEGLTQKEMDEIRADYKKNVIDAQKPIATCEDCGMELDQEKEEGVEQHCEMCMFELTQ